MNAHEKKMLLVKMGKMVDSYNDNIVEMQEIMAYLRGSELDLTETDQEQEVVAPVAKVHAPSELEGVMASIARIEKMIQEGRASDMETRPSVALDDGEQVNKATIEPSQQELTTDAQKKVVEERQAREKSMAERLIRAKAEKKSAEEIDAALNKPARVKSVKPLLLTNPLN